MDKLQYGKNYAHLFFIFVGISIFLSLFGFGRFISLMFIALYLLIISTLQLVSGVAIGDRGWNANCRKEDHPWQFYLIVILGFLIGIVCLISAFWV